MAGVGNMNAAVRRIEHEQGHRHEPIFHTVVAQKLVQSRQDERRLFGGGQAEAGFGRQFGHQQRRRDAMARDIRHHDRDRLVGQHEVIVVITADVMGGMVIVIKFQSGHLRTTLWQQPALHFASQFQVPLEMPAVPRRPRITGRSEWRRLPATPPPG